MGERYSAKSDGQHDEYVGKCRDAGYAGLVVLHFFLQIFNGGIVGFEHEVQLARNAGTI